MFLLYQTIETFFRLVFLYIIVSVKLLCIHMYPPFIYPEQYISLMFSERFHLTFLFCGTTVILFFILLPPTLLLLFYPTACFRRLSKCLKPRWALTIQIFTDVFYGSYKNGLNGTRDYRPVAGVIFITWISFGVLSFGIDKAFHPHISWSVIFISQSLAVAIACLVLEPYNEKVANFSGTVLLLNLAAAAALIAILDIYTYSEAMAWVVIAVLMLPHCMVYTYGAIRGLQWLKERAVDIYQGIGHPFSINSHCEGNQLLAK